MSDKPDSSGPGFDPLTGIPRLPAAFRGRRRFSLRPPEPEPEPDEQAEFMARARAWTDEDELGDVDLEEVSAPGSERDPAKAFLGIAETEPPARRREEAPRYVKEEPKYVFGIDDGPSSGLVYEGPPDPDDGSARPERALDLEPERALVVDEALAPDGPSGGGLPRLQVAGSTSGGPELPRPARGKDWPTETPPRSPSRGRSGSRSRTSPADHARGADDSLGESRAGPVQFGGYIRPEPVAEQDLGHTLAPRETFEESFEPVAPPRPDPRPSLDDVRRDRVRSRPMSRPMSRSRAPTPPPTQMPVPNLEPVPHSPHVDGPPSAEVELEPSIAVPAESLGVSFDEPSPSEASSSLLNADLLESFDDVAAPSSDEDTWVFTDDDLPRGSFDEAREPGSVDAAYGIDPSFESADVVFDDDEAPARTNAATRAAVGCLVAFAVFGTVGSVVIFFVVST